MPALAKLTRPRLHQVVARERLFERLDDCRRRGLVWVVGPPGAGKSALVASYVEMRKLGGVWYQVDAGDRDLATFFHYLTRAALEVTRKRSVVLPLLTPEHRGDLPGFARLYFRALFECLKAPAALVLDNYHELPAEAELHALLEVIAREVPDGYAIVATSRTEPPAECAALRALDRLALLDWDELRLTLEETRRIAALRQVVDETVLRQVHEHAGGWPVGLTLTLEQVKRGGGGPEGQAARSREVLFNYFAGQIVAALPDAGREQLMRVALLPRATGAQAAEIAQDAAVGALLESLYRKRLFVERRGDAWQFHDLFRAFLLAELERTRDAAALNRLRSAAAALLAAADQVEAAFALAASAQDWECAVRLVLGNAPRLFEHGRSGTLREWFTLLPGPLVETSAWLMLWLGVATSSVAPVQAREHFERSYALFPLEERVGRVLSCSAILITHWLEFDHGAVDRWLDELLPLLDPPPPLPARAAELRVFGALLFGLTYQRPRRELVDRCLARIRALLTATDVPVNARVDAATLLIAHHQVMAEFDHAERILAIATPWLADPELTPNYRAMWTLQVAHYYAKAGRDAESERAYDQAEAIARDNALTLPPLRVYLHMGRALLGLNSGDIERVEAERASVRAHWTFARKLDSALDVGIRALVATHRGEYAEAVALGREQVEMLDRVGPIWLRVLSRAQLVLALADAGCDADVSRLVDETRTLIEGTCLVGFEDAVVAAEAYAALRQRGADAARPYVQRCLGGGGVERACGFLRVHPRAIPAVLEAALAAGIEADYVRRVIRRFSLRPTTPDPPGWPWPFEVRMLGRFEVLCDGKPLEFSRKLPRKTLALLKAIVALGGGSVSEQRLIDTFWADEEGDAAARALDATVLRLRTLLGDSTAVAQRGGRISLDLDRTWVDVFAFERALTAAESGARSRDPGVAAAFDRALALYDGAFLPEDDAEAWTVATRERLRGRFIHALAQRATALEAGGEHAEALALYLRGLDADPVVESFYQGLMRCYQHLQRRTEAIAAYRRLRQVLSVTLGLAPSTATERLYQTLRADAD